MLHLANPNVAPPGSFRIRDAELALKNPSIADVGPFHALRDLETALNKRRQANGLPALSVGAIENQLCQHLPPGHCVDEHNIPTFDPGAMSLTLQDAIRGTRTLLDWISKGSPRVPADEAVKRSYLCNECPLHVPIHGCQGCSGNALRSLVNEVVAGQKLPTDSMLGGCGVCKCSLPAKVRIPVEILLPHMSQEQKKALWERCWLREGGEQ